MARRPSLDFKLFGPWDKVSQLMGSLAPNVRSATLSAQRTVAEKFYRLVRSHLRNQDIPGWTPLSVAYAKAKKAKYGTNDILLASWTYYESIKVWRSANVYHVGVPSGLSYENGVEISRVAAIHEKWSMTSGKPHRPLWNYTLGIDMGGLKGIRKTIRDNIKERLQLKGYPVMIIKW